MIQMWQISYSEVPVAIHFILFPADHKYLYILINSRLSQIDFKYFKAFLNKIVGSPL